MRAMTVDPADSVAFLQRREAARQRDLDARFRTAWADFDRIVEMIVHEFAPLRIWQWGSLLHRRHFSGRSDIDIAVEGLGRAERLFRLRSIPAWKPPFCASVSCSRTPSMTRAGMSNCCGR